MGFIIIGIVTAINMIVIISKLKHKRYEDAIFDTVFLVTVAVLFSGSYGGMVVAMIASMVMSIYLYAYPPMFFRTFVNSKGTKKAKSKFTEGLKAFAKDLNSNGSEELIDTKSPTSTKELRNLDL